MSEPRGDYQRTGDPDPSKWKEEEAKTGRPNDLPLREEEAALPNSSFAERRAARLAQGEKRVGEAENKAVTAAKTKRPARKR